MSTGKRIPELDKNSCAPFLLRECLDEMIGNYIAISEFYKRLSSADVKKARELVLISPVPEEDTEKLIHQGIERFEAMEIS